MVTGPRRSRVLAVASVVALLAAGCSGEGARSGAATTTVVADDARPVDVDGTIVRSGDRLWIASPDDRSLGVVDPESLETTGRVGLDGTPARVLAVGEQVMVSFADAGALAMVLGSSAASSVVSSIDLPCAAADGLVTWWVDDRQYAAAACPVDARVAIVDLYTRTARGWLDAPDRSTLVTVDGDALVVASATGTTRRWSLGDLDSAVADAPPSGPVRALDVAGEDDAVWSLPGRRTSQVKAFVPSPVGAVAAYQIVDSERAADPTDPADTGSYASVIEGTARIEPAISGWCPHQFSDFSDRESSLSGPSALAVDAEHERLWVVGQFTGNVVVLDCAAPPRDVDGVDRAVVLASFDVGVGAAGIVVSHDGRSAWVDSAFDHAVVRLDIDDDGSAAETDRTVRDTGPLTLSARAEQGRRVFHDATDPHVTPNRVVTCASCHTAGGDDGLNWRISTREITTKYRRTPALWSLSPDRDTGGLLHWDGGVDGLDPLTEQTIQELLGGDGLLVDRSAIGQWLEEIPAPPGAWVDPSQADTRERGRLLFEGVAGCASCHTGGSGSDGLLHDVAAPSSDPDGVLTPVRTPRLVGLAGRAPYLHDGRALTLEAILTDNEGDRHGVTSSLTDDQRADLVEYLKGL